jgi:predicted nucleotidyltransferase
MKPITEEEMRTYIEGFKARAALKEARRKEIEERARRALTRCVEKLRAIPEVRRVILYGSLAKGTFQPGSDVDLAVEGLPPEAHFRVWAELEREADLNIDLERWEELGEGLRKVIQGYGQVLHEGP